jgi:hypothetical protein
MTDGVLLAGCHLSKATIETIGSEDGVVAKSLCAVTLSQKGACADAFEEIFLSLI